MHETYLRGSDSSFHSATERAASKREPPLEYWGGGAGVLNWK